MKTTADVVSDVGLFLTGAAFVCPDLAAEGVRVLPSISFIGALTLK